MKKEKNVKEEILKKANQIFAKYGYEKTTMDDIAKAVGKKKGALYYYFRTKEDVFVEVIEREIIYLKEKLFQSIVDKKTTKEKLQTYVLNRYKILNEVANFYQTFKEDYYRQFEFVQKLRKKFDIEEEKFIEDILKDGVKKGELKDIDVSLTAESFVVAMKGFEYRWTSEIDFNYVEKVIQSMLEIFFYGISKGVKSGKISIKKQ
ncbi:MAG: TetR/AcrR family transcriptional regulator [candidate division WOR-3 bacterium]|jgi:AcrR family transcriptional regulator